PDVRSLVAMLRSIDRDRETLARIRAALSSIAQPSAAQMVAEYHALAPVAAAAARYALAAASPAATGTAAGADALISQQMTLASMWKEMRSLHLRLTLTERMWKEEGKEAADDIKRLEKLAGEAQDKAASRSNQLAALERKLEGAKLEA